MVSDHHSHADIAIRCKSSGLRGLSQFDRRELKTLFKKEIRKGVFDPNYSNPHDVLTEFCDHVIREFGTPASVMVVIDNQPYLRRTARRLSKHKVPIVSLILYAAWIEHWMNMMLTVAMLRHGSNPPEPLNFLKTQPRFEDKLNKLTTVLGINELPKKMRDGLIEVVKLRNRHLHFTWEGQPPRGVRKGLQTVQSIVRKCEKLLDDAIAFEYQQFDEPHAKLVSVVFRLR